MLSGRALKKSLTGRGQKARPDPAWELSSTAEGVAHAAQEALALAIARTGSVHSPSTVDGTFFSEGSRFLALTNFRRRILRLGGAWMPILSRQNHKTTVGNI